MRDKYKYLGKNTLIFAISSFGTKILSFLLVPLYTSVLSTVEYGSADLITTTATLLVFVLTINISSSVLRFTIEQRKSGRKVLSYGIRVLVVSSLICGILLGLVYYSKILDWPAYYFLFIFLYFFATALYEIMTNYLRAIDKVKHVAIAGVLSSLIIIISNIVFLVIIKIGLVGYLVSLILGPLLASVFCILIAGEPIKTYFFVDCSRELKREMVIYCTPLIFNNIALWINAFLDRYFVTYYCGVAENGIYSVSGKISTILATFYSVFSNAWTLSAIIEFDKDDKDGFFSKTYNTYGALMTTLCSIIILFNIPLSKFLYSKNFFEAWRYSSILLMSVMFNTFTSFQGSLFTAAKETKLIATTTVISALVNTCLNILFIPRFGGIGAAVATAIAYFIMWLTRYIYLKRFINMKVNFAKDIFIYFIIAIQIVFEHLNGHFYIGQISVILIVLILNHKYFKTIFNIIGGKFKSVIAK